MDDHVALFEPRDPGLQQPSPQFRGAPALLAWRIRIKQPARIRRLIQIIAQTSLVLPGEIVRSGLRCLDSGPETLKFGPRQAQLILYTGNRYAKTSGVRSETHAAHQACRPVEPLCQRFVFFLETRNFFPARYSGSYHP